MTTSQQGELRAIDYLFVLSPGRYVGGAERYVQLVAEEMRLQYGASVAIAVSHNPEFYRQSRNSTIPSVYLGSTIREASRGLSSILDRAGIKAVVSSGYHSLYVTALAKLTRAFRGNHRPAFVDIKHGWIETDLGERVKTHLDKLASFTCDRIILVNPSMLCGLAPILRKKASFVPTGIRLPESVDRTPRAGNETALLRIIIVGRLSPEKRFDVLLNALAQLRQVPWELRVVGDGSEMARLQHLSSAAGIDLSVHFLGYQNNVQPYYESADLLVIASQSEGCPLVALEAMASGVLVLSTAVGSMPTLLGEGRGFLVKEGATAEVLALEIERVAKTSRPIADGIRAQAAAYVERRHNVLGNVRLLKEVFDHGR
jgi:glycosyltransferase involved in cell wall biosynthesis